MLSIPVTFYQRICLWNLCGNAQVQNLRDAAPMLRLVEKFRPTDKEMLDTQFRLEPERGFMWISPSPGYGDIEIEFEADEQEKLIHTLENQQGVKVSDAHWQFKLLDEFKAAKEAIAKEVAVST